MFEAAETGHTLDKSAYEAAVPALRQALLDAQFEVAELGKFPVIILVGGVDGAGKGDTVNMLNEWMDPRFIKVQAMSTPTKEERKYPEMWRYWHALPPKGTIGIFISAWYYFPILQRVRSKMKAANFAHAIEEIRRFEKLQSDEGAIIIKFWLHLSRDAQKIRFKSLQKNPATRWRVTDTDWAHHKLYNKFCKVTEDALRATHTEEAPWHIVEGSDDRYRSLTVGNILLESLRKRLKPSPVATPGQVQEPAARLEHAHVLSQLDLTQKLTAKKYKTELEKYQGKLNQLSREPGFKKISLLAVFEGADAAGKGGAIRRVSAALDARQYNIVSVAAPSEEERAHPYLWRFWRNIPAIGSITLFDRSWYGRVLVERVEKFCSEQEWQRAYGEINDFEEQLAESKIILVKFWLATSKDEQLERFRKREKTGYKRYKITPDDWRNRDKWDEYENAVDDMAIHTSSEVAPWEFIEANDKKFARIKVLKILCKRIEVALKNQK